MENRIYDYFDKAKKSRRYAMLDWNLIIREWIKQKLIDAFWIILFAAMLVTAIWITANQIGDLPPFVSKGAINLG